MRTKRQGSTLEITDNPAVLWLIAVMSVVVGAAFVYLALRSAAHADPPLVRAAALGIGTVGMQMGWFAASRAERVVVRVDRLRRLVTLTAWLPWRRREFTWSFDEIADFEAEADTDGDGCATWQGIIKLRTGERVAMSANAISDREAVDEAVEAARGSLGRR